MASRRSWVVITCLLLGGPAISSTIVTRNAQVAKAIDHGKWATAQITDVKWTKQYGRTSYSLGLSFTPEGGAPVKADWPTDIPTAQAVEDHKLNSVRIRYLPESPTVFFGEKEPAPSDAGVYVGIGAFVLGLIWLILKVRPRRRQTAKLA